MISHGKEVKVFAGNSNLPLAQAICDRLSKKLGDCKVSAFADGESVFFYPSCFADGTLTRTEKQAE